MLSIKIKDTLFKNQILTASGTFGYGNEIGKFVDIEKLGGVITKSVTLHPREGNPQPRIAETDSGMLNSIGLANLGVKEYCNSKLPYLNQLDTNFIINIAGYAIDDYIETLQILESSNGSQIGYEINISCPNVKEGGMEFGVDPHMTEKLTKELRKCTDKILIMKLSPNVTRIQDIAKAAENGGADCVSAINTVVGMGVNVKTRKSKINTVFGGLSGPAIKPIALANVHKIYQSISIPIIGLGGIKSAADIIEFILAGADLVQIGTLNYKEPGIGVRLAFELADYLKEQNIESISELKGQINI